MLILMFWLVIIGLSIVSMVLSVIQIKMEEWLYHLLVKMQKQYQQAVENGETVESEKLLKKLLDNESWLVRNVASNFITEKQAAQVEKQAETYERTTREFNNKMIQTENIQSQFQPVSPETQRSATMFTAVESFGNIDQPIEFETAAESVLVDERASQNGSELDAPSLLLDSKNSNASLDEVDSRKLIQECIDELALGREFEATLDLINKKFQAGDYLDQGTQANQVISTQNVSIDRQLSLEENNLLDHSQNTSIQETRDNGTLTPCLQTNEVGIGTFIKTEDKEQMTSDNTKIDKTTSVDNSVQTMFPDENDEDITNQLLLDADEKRRRYSNSRIVQSFEADEKEMISKSVQSSPTLQRINVFETGAQYSIEDPKITRSISVQCTQSKDLEFMEVGAQYSIEDPKIVESKAIQCSNFNFIESWSQYSPTLQRLNYIENGVQYSIEDVKLMESIGVQCLAFYDLPDLIEFGVQCSPQMMDEEFGAANQQVSIDIDDELSAEPRGAIYKAKIIRSSSTISLNSFELDREPQPIKEKLDIVLQTEDSYLRIARRLEDYRSIKTQHSLQVYATNPDTKAISSQHHIKQSLSNKEDKTHYLLLNPEPKFQWTRRRSSRSKNRRVSFQTNPPESEDQKIENEESYVKDDSKVSQAFTTDRPQIRVDSPTQDSFVVASSTIIPMVEAKAITMKSRKVVKTRQKSKKLNEGNNLDSQEATTSKESTILSDPFENTIRNKNELKLDETTIARSENVGQAIQAQAIRRKVQSTSTNIRSTPSEIESSNFSFSSKKISQSSENKIEVASSQFAKLISRKTSLPTEISDDNKEFTQKSGIKRRSSIFSLIRRDTTDSNK